MAIPTFVADLKIIQKQGDDPRTDDGLTTDEFKASFDKAGLEIQAYINEILVPAINAMEAASVVVGSEQPVVRPVLWFHTEGEG